MNFTVEAPDADTPVLEWALAEQQAADTETKLDMQTMVQEAFDGVMEQWRRQYNAARTIDIQATLEGADPSVKQSAVAALTALQSATPEQQKAALDQIAAMLSQGAPQ